jgi:ribosomal protein S18 acetylase RimI-like enzyme
MTGSDDFMVRQATAMDTRDAAQLLHDFNREFGESTPPVPTLARRLGDLIDGGDTLVLLAGEGPDGVAVLRLRHALWSEGREAYLAELYVRPSHRGLGIGRALMKSVLTECRRLGADRVEIGVDEPDVAARRLYESLGFTNRVGGPDGPVMFVYELDLPSRE